jgi:AcrR family transcriptional regulator
MKTKKIKTEIRKTQIASAALNLISDQGLTGLTMIAVAQKVGLVPSALYRHFKSKAQILDAIFDFIEQTLLGNIDPVRRGSSNPVEQLSNLLKRHIQFIKKNQSLPRLVFSDDVYQNHPERRMRVNQIIIGYLKRVAEIISRGQKEGKFRPEFDPDMLSIMFLGLIQPAVILWDLSRGRFDLKNQVEEAWQVFLSAILVRDPIPATMN